jgi:8-oxo-dGTP diphosphatase
VSILAATLVIGVTIVCAVWWARRTYVHSAPPPRPEIYDAITRPAVVKERTQRYVCGFAFHGGGTVRPRVVLIRKVKPDWQAGKLNGVGGKIEPGETSKTAMAREFHEETGVLTLPLEWDVFAKMHFPKAEVTFLRYFGDAAAVAQTMTVYSADLNRPIREAIEHRLVRGIDEIPDGAIMPNLRWAIPMAFHDEGGRGLVSIDYAEHN